MVFTPKFRDWASMMRLPNVPTVWSNVLVAWLLGGCGFDERSDIVHFLLALLAGTALYLGGALSSEVADSEIDRASRPERALPAGRISRPRARNAAGLLLSIGTVLLVLAQAPWWSVALVLGAILAYAKWHRVHLWIAVPLMAGCRVALGLSVALGAGGVGVVAVGWLVTLGVYIAGVSLMARGEAGAMDSSRYVKMLSLVLAIFLAISLGLPACGSDGSAGLLYLLAGLAWAGLALRDKEMGKGRAVGRMLAIMPLVDMIYLQIGNAGGWANVPPGLAVLAWLLQQAAAAT